MSENDPTKIIKRSSGSTGGEAAMGEGGNRRTTNPADPYATVILQNEESKPDQPAPPPAQRQIRVDFVRGWLVVVAGPGLGGSVEIGTGQCQIGRDLSNRIALPFGDPHISRVKHAVLTYDPKERDFTLINSHDGSNLTYLNGHAVHSPVKLVLGDVIELGGTKLRFVPLCGETFDWPADAVPDTRDVQYPGERDGRSPEGGDDVHTQVYRG